MNRRSLLTLTMGTLAAQALPAPINPRANRKFGVVPRRIAVRRSEISLWI